MRRAGCIRPGAVLHTAYGAAVRGHEREVAGGALAPPSGWTLRPQRLMSATS